MCNYIVLTIVCLIGFASSQSIVFQDCANKEVIKVTSNLSNGTAFIIHKGKDFTFDAMFKADYSSSNITVRVSVMVAGQEMPVKDLYSDGCKEGNLICPLKAGMDYTLKYYSHIPANHPDVSADLVIRLVDEMDRILVCFKVAVAIQE